LVGSTANGFGSFISAVRSAEEGSRSISGRIGRA
jgi:hypothetical protein